MTTQTPDIHSAINALIENFESTFLRGDAADIADLYTDNGMLLPPESDIVKGKRDIEVFWQMAIDMGIKNVKLDFVEIEQHGINDSHYCHSFYFNYHMMQARCH